MKVVEECGGIVAGVGVVVDRSGGNVQLHENQFAVTSQTAVSYAPDEVSEELQKIPIEKPGSRSIK